MINEKFKAYLSKGLGMGLGTRDATLTPDFNRVLGGYVVDEHHVTIFMDEPTSTKTLENIRDNQMMSIVMVDIANVESYQMKGRFTSLGKLTQEEERIFKKYMELFDEVATGIGLLPGLIYRYPHSDMIAATMEVEEVFEQTPKKGTGNKI